MKPKNNPIAKRKYNFVKMTSISLALLLIISVFSVLIASEIHWQYDMTKDQIFTLSDETMNLFDDLKNQPEETIKIAAIYQSGKEDELVKRLLDTYDQESDQVQVEYIDIDREPTKLAKYKLNIASINNMTIIVQSSQRTKMVYQTSMYYQTPSGNAFEGEKQISGAIRFTLSNDLPKVYFTEGHNEADSSNLLRAKELLGLEAYESQTLDLVREGSIPKDAAVVMIVSPKVDFTEAEIDALDDYVKTGGKLLTMVDAMSTNTTILENYNDFLHQYGLDITNNFVVEEDPKSYLGDNNMYLIPSYIYHYITKELAYDKRYPVLPIALGLRSLEVEDHITVEPLLASSNESWMRLDVSNAFSKKTDNDIAGPITLASSIMINNAKKGYEDGRMIVIGNSSFIYNDQIKLQANSDFFKNCVNWLYGRKNSSTISPKIINADTLQINAEQMTRLIVICSVIIPFIFFIGAFLLWLVRRNQ